MIFLWQRCKIPSFEPMHSKLYGFDSLEFGGFKELLNILFAHSVIFIVVKLLSLAIFVVEFLLTLLDFINGCRLLIYFTVIDFQKLFSGPSVRTSINTQEMDIIFVSHGFLKLCVDFFVLRRFILFVDFFCFFLWIIFLLLGFLLLLSFFELLNILLKIGHLILFIRICFGVLQY